MTTPATDDEQIAELLPCPFCGAPATIVTGADVDDEPMFSVSCTNSLGFEDLALDCPGHEPPLSDVRSEVVSAWNRREVYPPLRAWSQMEEVGRLTDEVARLRGLLDQINNATQSITVMHSGMTPLDLAAHIRSIFETRTSITGPVLPCCGKTCVEHGSRDVYRTSQGLGQPVEFIICPDTGASPGYPAPISFVEWRKAGRERA